MPNIRHNPPIKTWQPGDVVQGYALLSRKEQRQDRNNQTYLDLELTDATGSVSGKVWSNSPALKGDYAAHGFVAFQGTVKLYREQLQISLDQCRQVTEEDRRHGFDETALMPSAKEDLDDLWGRLVALYPDAVERPVLKHLAGEALERFGQQLREHPAAKGIHHAYLGGLLEHVVSMAELAETVAEHYPDVDRDLVLLGVLFHDLGKIRELGAMPANDYTVEGRLVGHVVMGRDMLRECAGAIPDFPDDLLVHLEHLVLSHQGKKEYASPVEPMTPEAFVLHALDDLDSKLNQLERVRDREEEGMVYMRALGRFVYLTDDGSAHPGSGESSQQLEGRSGDEEDSGEAAAEQGEEDNGPARGLFD